jgi:hypothetical protein
LKSGEIDGKSGEERNRGRERSSSTGKSGSEKLLSMLVLFFSIAEIALISNTI